MLINFKRAESLVNPSEIDTTSSPDGIFIRKNVKAVEVESENAESIIKYVYDEAFLTPDEYELYKTSKYEMVVNEAVTTLTVRREAEIIDDYTLQLIEEGVLWGQ